MRAIKKAEDGNALIVRLQELSGRPAPGLKLSAAAEILSAREVDGQERDLGEATVASGTLNFDLNAYGLSAFALTLAAPAHPLPAPQSVALALPFDEDVFGTFENLTRGHFDAEGRSYPAEAIGPKIVSEGIEFTPGPVAEARPNALVARGQILPLPPGKFDRIYVLAASAEDKLATFMVGYQPSSITVQAWDGAIGEWDTRIFGDESDAPVNAAAVAPDASSRVEAREVRHMLALPEKLLGLTSGFVKPANVAWYSSHRHTPAGTEPYSYCYLFKYGFDVPPGATSLQLPNSPSIRIFAVTCVRKSHDRVSPAGSHFDNLADRVPGAAMPLILPVSH